MNSSRTCMLYFDKSLLQLLFLISFTTSFCRRHSLMNQPCYNNLFQIMQHDNFWNLNGVNFTKWKHLESQFSAVWCCFKVIKQYNFHYLLKSIPIPGNKSSFEILQLFDTWRHQSLWILFFSSDAVYFV